MTYRVLTSISLALSLCLTSAACTAQTSHPKLIVVVTVDQLRGDLIQRYAPAFTGGLKRMLDEGYRFENGSHAHAITHTAAGHASISTGTFPSRSGIVANSWQQREGDTWTPMYAVEDPESPILGVEGAPGRSPRNLLRDGLADWVLSADPSAQVVSLSAKDRSAVTMAGRSRGQVYWTVPQVGRFVTSTYYRAEYPEWLNRFNAERMPGFVTDTVWENGVDEGSRGLARADSAVYENDGVHTTFPHHALEELDFGLPGALSSWNLGHPNADAAVFALAKEAIGALGLGRRGVVDYLSISLSATDYVGHGYGPFSQEQLDNLVRLDGGLGRFIDELDASVGTGGWVMALSADHGVQTMPEYLAAAGEPAVRVDWGERGRAIGSVVAEVERAVGTGDLLADSLAHRLEGSGLVEKAYTHRDLTRGEPADSFAALFQNSYFPGRAGGWISTKGVEVRFPPNHLVSGPTGTTHGSPYWYDRHVPIIFFGAGIEKGVSSDGVHTVDIAPTLAALAGISAPTDLDGRILIVP